MLEDKRKSGKSSTSDDHLSSPTTEVGYQVEDKDIQTEEVGEGKIL